jgi:coenzyme Q-binding protein COQ10
VISFKVFREKFGSRVTLWPERRVIDTDYLDGPFKYLRSQWSFAPDGKGCRVDFWVEFEFRNRILQSVIGVVFNEAMNRVVRAFETRAKALYG